MDWKQELEEKGVVVIPGIFTPAQCRRYIHRIEEQVSRAISPEKNLSAFLAANAVNGVIHGLDNLRVLWEIRTDSKIREIFHELYGPTTPLYLYVDRFNYRPRGHLPLQEEWHIDEDPTRPQSEYQAFVSLTRSGEEDDCLGILEKSHRYMDEYVQRFPLYPFYREQYDWLLEKGCTPRRVACLAGSLVLWDSRCYHTPLNSLRPVSLPRVVVYTRYFPAERFPEDRRRRIFLTYPEFHDKSLDLVTEDDVDYHPYLYGISHIVEK